ncbi:MAG: urea ABC transporter ATP-binding protein UrtD [Betaproteobacteria bacterium]|nr:urea ABC transporter ATP-binding protein UrtD [Betaproteobacteria bacterium]
MSNEPILELRDVAVDFSGFRAINGLNLQVAKGELRCLIGPNGAGKTTALDVICGKVRARAGRITLMGQDITRLPEYKIARRGVGRKFQVPSVFRELTVRDNLEVAYCKRLGVFANVRRLGRSAERNDLEKLAELVGLEDVLDERAGYLSHGQTQWLEIALLLAQDSGIILLDEPTAGMTAQETMHTAKIVNALKGRHTLLVVEHDMAFVREISDIITVMHQGRVLAEGSASEIQGDPAVREAYLGQRGIAHA